MKKPLSSLFAVLLFTAVASGCGGGSSSSATNNTATPNAAVKCNQPPTLGSTTFGNGCFK